MNNPIDLNKLFSEIQELEGQLEKRPIDFDLKLGLTYKVLDLLKQIRQDLSSTTAQEILQMDKTGQLTPFK